MSKNDSAYASASTKTPIFHWEEKKPACVLVAEGELDENCNLSKVILSGSIKDLAPPRSTVTPSLSIL